MTESDTPPDEALPAVGSKVVRHLTFGPPQIGTVVPRERWSHPHEMTPDSFIVEYDDRRSRHTLDETSATADVVHVEHTTAFHGD